MQQRIAPHPACHLVSVSAPFRNPLAPVAPPSAPVLLPVIAHGSDLTPHLERMLHPVAIRAQAGDWAARDALFAAFEPKLHRISRNLRTPPQTERTVGIWDHDDVWQEAWLAFAALVEAWPPHIPFGRYVLANFPWRLRDAVRKTVRRPSVPPRFQSHGDSPEDIPDVQPAHSQEDSILIRVFAESLEPVDAEIFRRHVLEGESQVNIARQLGRSERTIGRRWQRIRLLARETLRSG